MRSVLNRIDNLQPRRGEQRRVAEHKVHERAVVCQQVEPVPVIAKALDKFVHTLQRMLLINIA